MQSIADIIQALARQRGRGEAGPLIALRQLDGAPGERISHLPVDRELASAWPAMVGEPFRPHQAAALAALRRGDPVALCASSGSVNDSALLLLYAALADEPDARALVLAPDEGAAHAAAVRLRQINEDLPVGLRLATTLVAGGSRADPYARVVVTPPEGLHSRMLRHHDRAWRTFWPSLRMVVLPDIQRHAGVAGAHLGDLLLRSLRVVAGHGGAGPALVATLPDLADPGAALASLLGQQWRVVPADDVPRSTPALAVWHAGAARLRDAAELAMAIQRQGYRVHIACGALERSALAPVIGEGDAISAGPGMVPAQALVVAGAPGSTSELQRMLRSGYQAVAVVLGDLPHEQALARHVELLISGPPAAWPPPPANAYVTAQHVLCAASELPLTATEVEAWGAQEVVDRLAAHRRLIDLPDPEVAWKPSEEVGDPYVDFTPLAASGAPILARSEQGRAIGTVDPTGFERWTYAGAALPPGAGGVRVLVRDEEHGSITLRIETSGRRTYPLRRCAVEVRETRATRAIAGGRQIGWGRVIVEEQIEGYRELTPGQAPAEVRLPAALTARWAAPACWFEVGDLKVHGQLVGWSLAAVLPLRALASFTDTVPCYDQKERRLYLVDAQPGGSGLAVWTYTHAEELLPLAHDVAVACSADPLLEPASRADRDWLLALLGAGAARERGPQIELREPASRAPAEDRVLRLPPPAEPQRALQPPPAEPQRPVTTAPHADRSAPPLTPAPEAPPPAEPQRVAPPPVEPSRAAPPAFDPPRPARTPRPAPADRRQGRAEGAGDRRESGSAPADRRQGRAEGAGDRREPASHRPDEARRDAGGRAEEPPSTAPMSFDDLLPPVPEPPRRRESAPPEPAPPASPPARREPAPPPPQEEVLPDAAALIERLRRQREQRERASGGPPRREPGRPGSTTAVEPRFAAGDRVFCPPYGYGTVQRSQIQGEDEVLTVQFEDFGDLTIDSSRSVVRKVEESDQPEDDLL